MLIIKSGDLLDSDCNVICHQVNSMGVMGGGIALQIRKQYPLACKPYFEDNRTPEEKLGTYVIGNDIQKSFVHLYGQLNFGTEKQHTEALESALDSFLESLQFDLVPPTEMKIGFPLWIGSGLGGGDPKIIITILLTLSEKYNIDFYLYNFN